MRRIPTAAGAATGSTSPGGEVIQLRPVAEQLALLGPISPELVLVSPELARLARLALPDEPAPPRYERSPEPESAGDEPALFDTPDLALQQLGLTLCRSRGRWLLELPRGERIDAPAGPTLPPELARLLGSVARPQELGPAPELSTDADLLRLQATLDAQRRALLVHDPGTRLGHDPENLHELRVAVRRTRAFLRAARRLVDPDWAAGLVEALRELGRVTSPLRDLDVLLAHVRGGAASGQPNDGAGAGRLLAQLEVERALAHEQVVQVLDGEAYRGLLDRLGGPVPAAASRKERTLEEIATQSFRGLVHRVDLLGKHPTDRELHALRIKVKRTRYTMELAGSEHPAWDRFLDEAKSLQALLGEHQDAVVAEQRIRAAAVAVGTSEAAYYAGQLAERQRRRRERVASRLPRAWARLRKRARRLG
jgi:CHAD domain-containing protein